MEHIIAKLLEDFEQGKMTRRHLIQSIALTATAAAAVGAVPAVAAPAAAADRPVLKAVSVNHLSFDVHDHKKLCDFYSDLFGMKVWGEGVKAGQCHLEVGSDTFLTLRDRPAGTPTPRVEHIAIGMEHYDKKLVEEATKSRGIEVEWEAGGSPKIRDPEGFVIQIVPRNNRDA